MKVDIEIKGIKELISKISDIEKRQLPYATVKALNKTAEMVQTYEKMYMKKILDRPTPYALSTLVIDYAYKNKVKGLKLDATVRFTDKTTNFVGATPGANFIFPHVAGGTRNIKRFEYALRYTGILPDDMYIAPGSACKLDAYGNIPNSIINKVISYFGARYKIGYNLETTAEKKVKMKRGTKRKIGMEYIVSRGQGSNTGRSRNIPQHLPPGIYIKYAGSIGPGRIRPLMMFVRTPAYQMRFPFYKIAHDTVNKFGMQYFNEAMADAIKTAK